MPEKDYIILDRSRNSRAFGPKENLWAKELARVADRLRSHRKSLGASQSDGEGDQRPYLSIAIFGPSGSGKSSLLRTLVRQANRGGLEGMPEEGSNGLHALPVMQPDRFARHDHFLYAFVANALKDEKDRRERREREWEEQPGGRTRRYEPGALSPVQQRFQELSDFLRVIDEPEKSRDYDPLGLSLERLERHTSALLLKERIGSFIDSLANELAGTQGYGDRENSVILLPVDDADMSPEHLVTALQVFQTYLLHPRLVPVFTFTDRTAEEILRSYFHSHMFTVAGHSGGEPMAYASPGEGTQRLPVADQLALQYLARCFPVRNRIRLGPAPARLRNKKYLKTSDPSEEPESVHELLLTASRLLFGEADRASKHRIRAALRPSTLRRQFHVVDEMAAADVEQYLPGAHKVRAGDASPNGSEPGACKDDPGSEKNEPEHKRWVEVFDRAAWSLMNVHRDVLREYDLYLEDLYSWTPQALRRLLLETLLSQRIEVRRALLRRWRFRLSSRRGETLSLLAANVFRPWIPGEEPSGDAEVMDTYCSGKLERLKMAEGDAHLSAPTALLWFLDLLNGFYQPQLLAWDRPNDIAISDPAKGRIVGLGWNLESGPVNAIRAAEENDSVAAAGMLFLDPYRLSGALSWARDDTTDGASEEDRERDQDAVLLLRCWTYYGFSRGRYWAALSFWRGLSLIGQILQARREIELGVLKSRLHPPKDPSNSDTAAPEDAGRLMLTEEEKAELITRVRGILRNHLIRGLVPGELVGEGEREGRLDVAFRRWDLTPAGRKHRTARTTGNSGSHGLQRLEDELCDWAVELGVRTGGKGGSLVLCSETEQMIELMSEASPNETDREAEWRNSLLRRLHGDDLVGSLLTRLNTTYIEDQGLFKTEIRFNGEEGDGKEESSHSSSSREYRWTAGIAMTSWTRTFLDYWRGLGPMQNLLRTCPLLAPFAEGPLTDKVRESLVENLFKHDEKEDEIRQRLGEIRSGWRDAQERPRGGEAQEERGKDLESSLAQSLGRWHSVRTALGLEPGDGLPEEFVQSEELEEQLERFVARIGHPAKLFESGGAIGSSAEGAIGAADSTEEGQIDQMMQRLTGVALFHALSRVTPDQFKPSPSISLPTTRTEVSGPGDEPVRVRREAAENREASAGPGSGGSTNETEKK